MDSKRPTPTFWWAEEIVDCAKRHFHNEAFTTRELTESLVEYGYIPAPKTTVSLNSISRRVQRTLTHLESVSTLPEKKGRVYAYRFTERAP